LIENTTLAVSRLTDVLGRLLYENRLGEEGLLGLPEEKMKSIRSFAQFLRDGAAWAAASFLATERNFRRIMGWKDLWQLEAILVRKTIETAAFQQEVA
jgi:hypothetical protein